jgi:uncharacterized protein
MISVMLWTSRIMPGKETKRRLVLSPVPFDLDGQLQYNYNIIMSVIRFEWDETKNQSNIRKHQVSFGEAKSVFYDPNALLIHDPDHSEDEDRFVMLGMTDKARLLIVCHCYREDDEVIRLISARKANTAETMQYGG